MVNKVTIHRLRLDAIIMYVSVSIYLDTGPIIKCTIQTEHWPLTLTANIKNKIVANSLPLIYNKYSSKIIYNKYWIIVTLVSSTI